MEYKLKIHCNKNQLYKLCGIEHIELPDYADKTSADSVCEFTKKLTEKQMDDFVEMYINNMQKKSSDAESQKMEKLIDEAEKEVIEAKRYARLSIVWATISVVIAILQLISC